MANMIAKVLGLRPRCRARTPGAMNFRCDRRWHLFSQHEADDGFSWEPMRWGGG